MYSILYKTYIGTYSKVANINLSEKPCLAICAIFYLPKKFYLSRQIVNFIFKLGQALDISFMYKLSHRVFLGLVPRA